MANIPRLFSSGRNQSQSIQKSLQFLVSSPFDYVNSPIQILLNSSFLQNNKIIQPPPMNKCSLLQQRAAARWHHVIKHYSPGVKPLHTWHLNIKPDLTYDYQLNRLYRVIVNLILQSFYLYEIALDVQFWWRMRHS